MIAAEPLCWSTAQIHVLLLRSARAESHDSSRTVADVAWNDQLFTRTQCFDWNMVLISLYHNSKALSELKKPSATLVRMLLHNKTTCVQSVFNSSSIPFPVCAALPIAVALFFNWFQIFNICWMPRRRSPRLAPFTDKPTSDLPRIGLCELFTRWLNAARLTRGKPREVWEFHQAQS